MKIKLKEKAISEQLLKGNGTMSFIKNIALDVKNRLGEGYEINDFENGKYRGNVSIRAVTKEAKKDNMENNTLLKAVKKMIEVTLYNFLKEKLGSKVYSEKKGRMPEEFIFFERVSGSERNHINHCSFAIQSYSSSLLGAVQLNEKVKKAMKQFTELAEIASCNLETDYNFTDTTTKKHRYQAIFNIIYYEN